ncbi:MAG: hypothetical protein HY290_24380, partial [Planctomycetia bacterium]|nr:hypothetical protein [Planctomycetia bacterium]
MLQRIALVTIVVATCTGIVIAQQQRRIQRGRIVKIDADAGEISLRAEDGKVHDFTVTPDTRVMDADRQPLKAGLKSPEFKVDAPVRYVAGELKGKRTPLVRLAAGHGENDRSPSPSAGKVETSQLKPLTELGTAKYHDFEGGLYPGGKTDRPAAHDAAGVALSKLVRPLGADGKPADDGRIVLLSIGMSNTSQEFSALQQLARGDRELNPQLLLVNGAQGAMTAAAIQDPKDGGRGTQFWETVDQRLREGRVSREQVQAVWLKQADAGPRSGFPAYARTLQEEMEKIVQVLHERFPNLKLVYVSSRIYAGYATTPLNPEPYAYESGFSVKWLI